MNLSAFALIAALISAVFVLRGDLLRRKLSLAHAKGLHLFTVLDMACPAAAIGIVIGLLPIAASAGRVPIYSPVTWGMGGSLIIAVFLWGEGKRQLQFQRPAGIVFSEWLVLAGILQIIETILFGGLPYVLRGAIVLVVSGASILAGVLTLAIIVPRYMKRDEGLHILDRVIEQGESIQSEYMPSTPECPHPERWQMVDSQTSELEILEFLKTVVTTVKPELIVETGTFIGYSSIKMAEGLKANGFGKLITIEYDPAIFAKAKDRIDASGLGDWIEYRNASSLETTIEGTIDILFSDSHLPIREQEIRKFLPQIDPRGLILIHDASSHFQIVREAALRLEQEGLISVVLLPTPRGLVVAQKRAGRK